MIFRGSVSATAFLFDPSVIGTAEARRRVLDWWSERASIHLVPNGTWLLVLKNPVTVRAEHAPGLPLTASDVVTIPIAGVDHEYDVDSLPLLDLTGWVDVGSFAVHRLTPADAPPPEPVVPVSAIPAVREQRRTTAASEESASSGLWFKVVRLFTRASYDRYLDRLTKLFRQKAWDDALRQAISIGGSGGHGTPTFRMPQPRPGPLRPTPFRRPGGRMIAGTHGDQHRLAEMYLTAATELEKAGRIEEAAFVHADLRNDPLRAVTLLAGHEMHALAAELAEGRDLPADLIVRLWWQAGNRTRAVDVARVRGAFPTAIAYLSHVDALAAKNLRREWISDRQRAGDHLGAVGAAWPVPELRSLVEENVRGGMALGGPGAAQLLAYLVAEWPSESTLAEALSVVESDSLALTRERFVTALSSVSVRDPAMDRRLCTAAIRAMHRDRNPVLVRKLTNRSDPLVVADLPPVSSARRDSPVEMHAAVEPGPLPVFDAVRLGDSLLVAHGEAGVRLLTSDGRVRAQWTVPAYQFVVADHGGTVLLVARYDAVREVHRLDLTTRKVTRWTTLGNVAFLPSYDGSVAFVLDADGLAVLDALSPVPRVVWRELSRADRVYDIVRSPSSLAAIVNDELWRWDLPSMMLRQRTRIESLPGPLTATGFAPDVAEEALISGSLIAIHDGSDTYVHKAQAQLAVTFNNLVPAGFRAHADTVTVWDADGRVLSATL
ncbi:bpX6 domain-containing protein [Actinocrispum sp. NPDC049592]|uniref:bpX6 domain-containing protein n=1 Tax=Actinocrispum sp. NPDC049592 TaxID=3154835 RepID=UPI00343861EA